jgi:hypothetical protein
VGDFHSRNDTIDSVTKREPHPLVRFVAMSHRRGCGLDRIGVLANATSAARDAKGLHYNGSIDALPEKAIRGGS